MEHDGWNIVLVGCDRATSKEDVANKIDISQGAGCLR